MKPLNYGQGSILKAVLFAAGPMMAAQVLSLLYNIVDRMYIGQIPGQGRLALGGIGLCFPVLTLILAFANLYGSGGAPLAAMACGRKDFASGTQLQNTSFQLIVWTGLVLTVTGELLAQPILLLMGASPANLAYGLPYLRIVLAGTLFSMIATGMNPFLNAQGFVLAGMSTIAVGAILNIVLDPIMIFVFGWGIAGAAIATVISQAVSALVILFFLKRRQAVLKLELNILNTKLNLACSRKIVSLGFAGFVMQCTNSLVQSVSNTVLSTTGGDLYISVMTIVSSVRQILDTPIFGLTDGASPILSYNYGARQFLRVRQAIRLLTILGLAYTALVWLAILLGPEIFIRLFNQETELVQSAIPALTTYFFAFVFQALQYAAQTVFKSLNRRSQAIFFSLFRKVILVVPLTFLLPVWFGPMGVFAAEPVSNVIGGSLCFFTMLLTVYRKLGKTAD